MWAKIKAWLQREWQAVKKSGTMLLGWVTSAVGIIVATLADFYNDPNINSAIQTALKPEYVPYYVIALGLIIRFVRKRNATDI